MSLNDDEVRTRFDVPDNSDKVTTLVTESYVG